jgi:SNF2 family DNA or RNA helicase
MAKQQQQQIEVFVPREDQIVGAEFLASRRVDTQVGSILADVMGFGKTLQAALAWKLLKKRGPALLIARSNTQAVWLNQAPRCEIQTPYIISGPKPRRLRDWQEVGSYSFVTATLETVRQDIDIVKKIPWGMVIVEEAHKIVNHKTLAWKAVKQLRPEYLILITGSPLRRGFQSLWALLHICDPQRWSSYWRYINTYGYVVRGDFNNQEILGLRESDKLIRDIAPYYIRREMPEGVPPKTRILDHVLHLSSGQARMYNDLVDEMVTELSDNSLLVVQNVLARITRLRQILCAPKILDSGKEWGACIEHLGELLEDTDDHHFVVFTPFTKAIPIIRNYLEEYAKIDRHILTLQGGLEAAEVNTRIQQFRQAQGVMICSIAYAESFDLIPAKWSYFCGFSWAPDENLQAEDRIRRVITDYPTFYYYPTHMGCVDEELVMEACNQKATEMLKVYKNRLVLRGLLTHAR